ncbi:cysteine synthase [Globomyces pollinis-pini]|nr:cysteine synthase [Globomyces pollinis-pini]
MNPGGSVKDRAALYLVKEAESKGLTKGGTIVEGTAGNTGIGLAHVCAAKGYKCVIFIPNTQSKEKLDLLRMLGVDVRPVPPAPFTDSNNFNHLARQYADTNSNTFWTNQFDNLANKLAHYETTGPEIYKQMDGDVNAFVCATGTGGTLAGVTQYLKSQNQSIKVYLADPPGSVLYSAKTMGLIERTGDGSITEGIGQGRITDNLKDEMNTIDGAVHIPDSDSIRMVYELLHHEGLFVGASSALNVVAATKVARILGPGHRIVTIICDGAYRYQSRLFSKQWLKSKNLLDSIPSHLTKYICLD